MTTIDPAAAAAADTIAQFEGPSSALDSVQRWLHRHPLASPTLVLVLAVALLQPVHRALLHGAQPVDDPRPGHDHRHARRRPDARRAHRRHRPVGRLDHRAVVGGDGQAGPRLGLRAGAGAAPGHRHRHGVRRCSTAPWSRACGSRRSSPRSGRSTSCSPSASGSPRTRRCATRTSRRRRRSCCGSTTRGSRSTDSGSPTARCSCSPCSSSRGTCCDARRGVVTCTPPATIVRRRASSGSAPTAC